MYLQSNRGQEYVFTEGEMNALTFFKRPTGYIKFFGANILLPPSCVICGNVSKEKYMATRIYDPGLGIWLLGLKYSYRKTIISVPICRKHFFILSVLRILFLLTIVFLIFYLFSPNVDNSYFLLLSSFFFLFAYSILSIKSYATIFHVERKVNIEEIIMSIKDKAFFDLIKNKDFNFFFH
jgi:hypothetical protein